MGEIAEFKPAPVIHVGLAEIQKMAEAVAKSKLFGAQTTEQAMALMLVAQAEGLHPAIAARDYDIIQGRPSKKSEAMMRSFIANGGRVKWLKLDDTCAEATFSHAAGGEVTIKWDLARATTAGLSAKDMYKKYPRQMLRARCISEGVRTVCPMATSGMYVPEEIIDLPPQDVVDNTPVNETQAKELDELVTSTGSDKAKLVAHLNERFKLSMVTLTDLPARLLQDTTKIVKEVAEARKTREAQK